MYLMYVCLYFNCRSLLPKIDEVTVLCITNMPDIVCLVETWLCMDILDTEMSIPNYSIVRLDRNIGMVVEYLCTLETVYHIM